MNTFFTVFKLVAGVGLGLFTALQSVAAYQETRITAANGKIENADHSDNIETNEETETTNE